MSEEENKQDKAPVLDQARADALYWATNPKTPNERFSFANLAPEQPYALSLLKEILNFREQCCHPIFKFKDKNGKIRYVKRPHQAFIDSSIQCEWGNKFIDGICYGSVGVSGNRANKVLETVRDIGRPQNNMFGNLSDLFGGKDQELEQPEEVPAYE